MATLSQKQIADLTDVAHQHAAAEAAEDLDATLRTLDDNPVYELYPVGLQLRGAALVRGYYEHYFANVAKRMVAYTLRTEWINELGVLQEYDITCRTDAGVEKTFRVLGILKFGEKVLSGERLYADEEFLRILFGPLWAQMEPI